jgi:hypothetical protein
MRTMRSGVRLVAGAITLLFSGALSVAAQAPEGTGVTPSYPVTLRYGTGLVDIPVAWISPYNGDVWINISGTDIPACGNPCNLNADEKWNSNLSIETHWMQRFSLGLSIYSNNPEWGFYGQFLALTEKEGSLRPAIAIGFRNLGPYTHEERFLIGHDVTIDSTGGTTPTNPTWSEGFKTAPTFYGVATKNWQVGNTGTIGATLGYGTGIFSDDGGLGKNYNNKGQIVKGLFLGARYAFRPSESTTLNFMLENNGWDWNAGVVGDWKGIYLGFYATELEEGGMSPSNGSLYQVYNYTKFSIEIGLSTNIFLAKKGTVLRSEVADLQREQAQLNASIAQSNAKIEELQKQLTKAQAGGLAVVSKRREQLDAQIQEEKESIRRAEERLQQLQGAQKPPPPPPGGTPPR